MRVVTKPTNFPFHQTYSAAWIAADKQRPFNGRATCLCYICENVEVLVNSRNRSSFAGHQLGDICFPCIVMINDLYHNKHCIGLYRDEYWRKQ